MIALHRVWMLLCGVVGFVSPLVIAYGVIYFLAVLLFGLDYIASGGIQRP